MKSNYKSGTKKDSVNRPKERVDYSKANKKREEYEDPKALEDFKSFVKATGWKKSDNAKGTKMQPKHSTANNKKSSYSGKKASSNYGQKSTSSGGEKTSTDYSKKSVAPRGERSSADYGKKSVAPRGERTSADYSKKSVAPRGERTSTDYGKKSVAPRGERTSADYSKKSIDSRVEKTSSDYGKKSFDSRGQRSTTASQRSSAPGGQGRTSSNKKYGSALAYKEQGISDSTTWKSNPANKGKGLRDNRNELHDNGKELEGNGKELRGNWKEQRGNGKALHGNQGMDTMSRNRGACNYQRSCGSCDILHESYEKHLAGKQQEVDKLLKKYCKVETIIGMKQPDHYRHKVQVVFDHDKKGNPISGVYEEGSHRVVSIDQCLIHNEKADAIIASIRGMLKSFKILTYDEDTGYGLLRHVMIRSGYHSGEIMVVLVLASPIMPSKNNFVKALRKEHPEITTVVVNINDKNTSMVLGDKEQVIYGKGYIEDSLCGKTFRISPKSFYQVNPVQTELLYNKAIELADLSGDETVIDAYCGIGTIGLIASDHAKQVIGVELNKEAVRDAVVNAKRNEAANIEFYNNDAGVFMSQMAAKAETADIVFMDPPRTGSNPQFMDALAILNPKKVVYVSCNPITLERDLDYLTKKGFKAHKAIPVDMFPWTKHVETVVLLSRIVK
jgi:23S rRNA (uracil1939-C5)-methyltransferase